MCQSQVFQHSGRTLFEYRNDTKEKTITFHEVIIQVTCAPFLWIYDIFFRKPTSTGNHFIAFKTR